MMKVMLVSELYSISNLFLVTILIVLITTTSTGSDTKKTYI